MSCDVSCDVSLGTCFMMGLASESVDFNRKEVATVCVAGESCKDFLLRGVEGLVLECLFAGTDFRHGCLSLSF